MQRNSTKHGPRLDEEMKTETEPLLRGAPDDPRAEEWREQEGDPDGERATSGRTRPAAPDFDDVAERSEISRHLRLSTFPAERDALLRDARENNAPEHVLGELSGLPAGKTYGTVFEVWEALGHQIEQVEGRPFRGAEEDEDEGEGEAADETPEPMNREQRRHPEKRAPLREPTGAGTTKLPSPEDTSMKSAARAQDDYSTRAKGSGHKKKTADKWNQ
jgi:hypothetical protein